MARTYIAGYDKEATFTPDGASETTLDVTGWTLDDGGDILETTHTGSSGYQTSIRGVQRASGNVTANVDSDLLPNASTTPLLKFGTKGTIKCDPKGSGTPWTIHCQIEKVHWASVVNGLVTYNFDWRSDHTTTTFTYPA